MKQNKIIYPELSYVVNGICYKSQNELGRFGREKQYGDLVEQKLQEKGLDHIREFVIADTGNTVDFFVEGKLFLELKAKRLITKEDYYQVQRYLQAADIRLGIIVNFRQRYIKPIRIVKIETDNQDKYK